ncbi:allophanate hydrolase subunit 2-domain-containing protein [Mycena belliarum]|uniref:Allophanate hydrolase subunit 2-domain-containing protein n=1 Tax=Mycena belliarum TaxID=1033014 RepID=A0AAD6UAB7_9AGAR|nr:allophanate hydrolase subunit 2-domain-containing protein [Mycena belliae]
MHKLLVANRGEIALRIIRTAKAEGLATVAVYTPSDALSPHVTLADEAVSLSVLGNKPEPESQAYLAGPRIVALAAAHGVTMLHPGYGFLAENAAFAQAVRDAGIAWLGPAPETIRTMGMKHLARELAGKAGVACVPGSDALVGDVESAVGIARSLGFPVMLKASAGGGGMGMVVCEDEGALVDAFARVQARAGALFQFDGVFLERYFPSARHIEIQIFGNGCGDIVCMGERECSIQRRQQKIIEETPSPFLAARPELRVAMCDAAVRLGRFVKYASAGTVEFLVDNDTAEFYFLEMNTRIQVEHPITEAVHPGLDLVRMMIRQGAAGAQGLAGDAPEMQQGSYDALLEKGVADGAGYAMEVRVYAENSAEQYRPCPGILQLVDIPSAKYTWLRVESWVATGTTITPFFDPLLAKLIVSGSSRAEVISRLQTVLDECRIDGPTNNLEYLKAILATAAFQRGDTTTRFLNTFEYAPCSMTVLAAGVEMTVQDFPGRTTRLGIPKSGPMDSLAFRAANILVDNPHGTEGIELIVLPGCPAIFHFHAAAVVALTGKDLAVAVDGVPTPMWARIVVPAGGKLAVSARPGLGAGLRTYLAVRGGFPAIPLYLGSKSTSLGMGGFQGRALVVGDELVLSAACAPNANDAALRAVASELIPAYAPHFIVHVLSGPHGDDEYVTAAGLAAFYATTWRVSPSSNRLGIRLEGATKIAWARANGGAGGSHPSNILDNAYALGTLNINGDTPVILTNEGPDMGGYVCLGTVASGELWKLGQLSAGSTIEFRRVSWVEAMAFNERNAAWLERIKGAEPPAQEVRLESVLADTPQDPKLLAIPAGETSPRVVLRQAGDSAILVEYGGMKLDFHLRARIHAFETIMKQRNIPGMAFAPCIRSTMCHFDPALIAQSDVVAAIVDAHKSIPKSLDEMVFPGRRLTFPIVLDDQWSREALKRYMGSIRDKAVYLPSNIDYLARNNGFKSAQEVLEKLVASDWLVFGVGFYLACPFLIPIDPRCRIVAQKMNPSRTYTPQGAVGIAGVVAAIYPIVSPGGYMMYGRTLPAWQQWGKGPGFAPNRPWLLEPFDQVHFEPVTEEQYIQIESEFNAGRYAFKIEKTTFSMAEYSAFAESIAEEVATFEARQKEGVAQEELKEEKLLAEWEAQKLAAVAPAGPEGEAVSEFEGAQKITSPMFGNVWKLCCQPGDIIASSDTTVAIMEAMKTEIPVKAGEAAVGLVVRGFGKGIRLGASVSPGDVLIFVSEPNV